MQIPHLRAVGRKADECQIDGLLITQGQIKSVAKFHKRLLIQFLLTVGGHSALTDLSHTKTLFGVSEHHGGLSNML